MSSPSSWRRVVELAGVWREVGLSSALDESGSEDFPRYLCREERKVCRAEE